MNTKVDCAMCGEDMEISPSEIAPFLCWYCQTLSKPGLEPATAPIEPAPQAICECCHQFFDKRTSGIHWVVNDLCDLCIQKIDARYQEWVASKSPDSILDWLAKNPPKEQAVPPKESILLTADKLINGSKRDDYGNVWKSFNHVAIGWSVIFGIPVTPLQVALAQDWLKTCREIHQHKPDNLVDKAGYTGLADQVADLPSPMAHHFK
jgi:hypothetical protein